MVNEYPLLLLRPLALCKRAFFIPVKKVLYNYKKVIDNYGAMWYTYYMKRTKYKSAADIVLDKKDEISKDRMRTMQDILQLTNQFKQTRSFAVLKQLKVLVTKYNDLVELDESIIMPVR